MSLNFGAMISRSFEIAWRYKSLWVFGLFTGAGSSGLNLDMPDGFWRQLIGDDYESQIQGMFQGIDFSHMLDTSFLVTIVL